MTVYESWEDLIKGHYCVIWCCICRIWTGIEGGIDSLYFAPVGYNQVSKQYYNMV